MKGYDYDRLSILYMWVRRRLCHYGCSLCSRCGEEAMVFLMFTCIRGPGSSRRALAAAAYSTGLPCWSMALMIRLALIPMLKAHDSDLAIFGLRPAERTIYALADEIAREWNSNPLSRI